MQVIGELINNKIIIKKSKDVGRLYNKSSLGKPITNNRLQISLLEGVFLLEDKKIRIFHKDKEKKFQDLVKAASKLDSRFEIKYLVFKDLRKRGCQVKINENKKDFDFIYEKEKKLYFVSCFSERDLFNINKTEKLIKTAIQKKGSLWFAIVDEEGDLTYYDVSFIDFQGNTKEHKFSKANGLILENRIVIFDDKLSKNLFEKEFYGKPFGDGLQLSLVEALYLQEKGIIEIYNTDEKTISKKCFSNFVKKIQPDIEKRFLVFKDLKKHGLILKTGFKFGTHFRAYAKKPDETHAEYLIHTVEKNYSSIWAEMSRAVRLAHSVNKEIVFAHIDGKKINYISFGRLRP
jgi:tRNA-intron endonuclease